MCAGCTFRYNRCNRKTKQWNRGETLTKSDKSWHLMFRPWLVSKVIMLTMRTKRNSLILTTLAVSGQPRPPVSTLYTLQKTMYSIEICCDCAFDLPNKPQPLKPNISLASWPQTLTRKWEKSKKTGNAIGAVKYNATPMLPNQWQLWKPWHRYWQNAFHLTIRQLKAERL